MNRRFATLFALGLCTLATVETADADRFRFGGGGRVRVHARVGAPSGGVSVSYSRPYYRPRATWSVGGSIYVGGGYYPRYRYYRPYYYYTPVPSYYGYYSTTYYPVSPAPAVTTTVAEPPRRQLPTFGLGVFAGGIAVEDRNESSNLGLAARLRLTPGLILQGEISKMTFENDERVDRRLGASLIYEIGAYNKLAPYVLAGLGVQQADTRGEYETTQNYGELGIGLRWAVTPNFHLTADIRAGSRATVSDDRDDTTGVATRSVAPPTEDSSESEEYQSFTLGAIFNFGS